MGGCHAENRNRHFRAAETAAGDRTREGLPTSRTCRKALRLLLEEVRDLEEMVALLQKKRFGSSSEATPVQEEEEPLGVFPEAELEYKEDAPEPFKKDQRGVHKISEAGRWKLTSSNETENRIFDLDEEERVCPRCKGKLVWIGKELVREVFEYQRPKLKLVRYWQMSYKCPACHKKGRSVIVRASVPKPLLNHSLVAASVVAEIMYQKYVNAMPLYRQEAAWKQLGVTFSRTTMARWIIRCAERLAGASVERHAERASAKRGSACR